MAFVRVYTGDDGQSHFEDMDLLPDGVPEVGGAGGRSSILWQFPRRLLPRLPHGPPPPVRHLHVRRPDGSWHRRRHNEEFRPRRRGALRRPDGPRTHQPDRRRRPSVRDRAIGRLRKYLKINGPPDIPASVTESQRFPPERELRVGCRATFSDSL